jgi:hypothetical protein
MSTNIYQALSEQFPAEMERMLNKGGTNLTYIPVSEVINRLNKVLGVDRWSFKIVRCERDATDLDFVVAHVRIDWFPEDALIVSRDGFGGQKIKRTKQGTIVDLGDEFKGAISDALKKAAQTLGVALYLARSEDAMVMEQVMDTPVAPPTPEPLQQYQQFKSLLDSLNDEKKNLVKAYWNQWSSGRKTPKPHEFTEEELSVLIAEVIRLQFDGSHVVVGNDPTETETAETKSFPPKAKAK